MCLCRDGRVTVRLLMKYLVNKLGLMDESEVTLLLYMYSFLINSLRCFNIFLLINGEEKIINELIRQYRNTYIDERTRVFKQIYVLR